MGKIQTNFSERVYALCKQIPKRKVTTYKAITEKLGTKAYRAVGIALKNNKDPINIPCFKVVKSDGSLGGYMGNNPEKIKLKIKKLEEEKIRIINGKIDLKEYLYRF